MIHKNDVVPFHCAMEKEILTFLLYDRMWQTERENMLFSATLSV